MFIGGVANMLHCLCYLKKCVCNIGSYYLHDWMVWMIIWYRIVLGVTLEQYIGVWYELGSLISVESVKNQ